MHGLVALRAINDRAAERQLAERQVQRARNLGLVEDYVQAAMEDAQVLASMVDPEEVARVEGMVEGYSNVLHYIRTGRS